MATIELSVSRNYVPNWGVWEALRELLQNALDAQDEGAPCVIKHWPKTNRLVIRNEMVSGMSMSRDRLLLGATSKAHSEARGQFGEGFKLALLVLTRKGIPVTVHTPTETWVAGLEHSATYDAEVLTIKTRPRQSGKATVEFVVDGVDRETWETVQKRVLLLTPPKEFVSVSAGRVLLDEEHAGRLYVGGLFVSRLPDDYRYGYDFRPSRLRLDRDRMMADAWDLRAIIAEVLSEAVTDKKMSVSDVLSRNSGEAQAMAKCTWALGQAAEAAALAFEAEYGADAVPVDDMQAAAQAGQHGMKAIVVSPETRAVIEEARGKFENRIKQRDLDTKHVYQPHELTAEEVDNLTWAAALVQRAHPFEESLQVVDFYGSRVNGVTNGQCIILARKVLSDRATLMGTLIHEVAHRYGADGETRHREAIERIAGEVIATACA